MSKKIVCRMIRKEMWHQIDENRGNRKLIIMIMMTVNDNAGIRVSY